MKLTDWFPPEVKPPLVGVYELQGLPYPYHWWTGAQWSNPCRTPDEVMDEIRETGPDPSGMGYATGCCWRGLAADPALEGGARCAMSKPHFTLTGGKRPGWLPDRVLIDMIFRNNKRRTVRLSPDIYWWEHLYYPSDIIAVRVVSA
jgi:hypothetical protein